MEELTVALVGNPNVGKSTLFNALTGLRQHTGNWAGKTVGTAMGKVRKENKTYCFVDLPGTYTLNGKTEDEKITEAFIREGNADRTVIVCDGSCLCRSLILALQVLPLAASPVLCINLMDEAEKRGIHVDGKKLSKLLGIPVVLTGADNKEGLQRLLEALQPPTVCRYRLSEGENEIDGAERLFRSCCTYGEDGAETFRRKVDRLLVSRRFGVPFLLLILLGIVWLTVWGANYPGMLLEALFDGVYHWLTCSLQFLPTWLRGFLLDGVYGTSARVISVMLPPMAIFFPLFTVLEDMGYLPRMAFLLDPGMARCGGCGKQALTLCMGLGCNAVGVTGCRIIDSPRERMCAILTNSFVPCNGRFPTLILLGSLFFPGAGAALVVAACVALGVVGAMAVSGLLNKTALKEKESTFVMELPPFRRPRLGQILVRSLLDRTLGITLRALKVAAPAGALLWLAGNTGLLQKLSALLQLPGVLLGMNGALLIACVFSLPANELLIPVLLMALTEVGSIYAVSPGSVLTEYLTWQNAVCTMVFTLFHWPCATTLMTVYRETKSKKTTAVAFLLPTAVGCMLCFLLNWLF